MSDESLNVYLDWLDACAKEQQKPCEDGYKEYQLSIALSENQRLTKIVEDYEEENATLKGKLLAIECADCGKSMLTCACDD